MSLKADNTIDKLTIKKIIQIAIILLIVLNFAGFLNLIKYVYGIISPILLGAGIAFVLNIIVVRYEKVYFPNSKNKFILRSRRIISIFLTFLTIILIIYFLLYIIIPQISQFIQLLSTELPDFYERTVAWIMQYAEQYPVIQQRLEGLDMSGNVAIERIWGIISNWSFGSISIIGIVFGKIIEFILALFFSIYVLFNRKVIKNNYQKLVNAYLNKEKREKLSVVLKTANETFSDFFLGQFKEAIVLGVLCTLGMMILRLPYATTIGSVVGLSSLIPLIGAYLGAIFGLLVIVMISPISAVVFLIFIVILQQVEGNFIYPKVVGNSIALPSIWVFAAIIVGGGLMGVIGIILGVPLAATIYKLLNM